MTVTPVNGDKVPMSPGFGQQPRFVVTIQPVGTIFNPPAQLTLPNVDGLAPRQVTEMYSYDHDLAAFVAIGTGTVSEDGSVIASDPGVGVIKAGWHCGGNPDHVGMRRDLSDLPEVPGHAVRAGAGLVRRQGLLHEERSLRQRQLYRGSDRHLELDLRFSASRSTPGCRRTSFRRSTASSITFRV